MILSRFFAPTLLLALSALFSRLLGVLRDHLLAKSFGASAGEGIYNLDAYYAAFRIPDLLYNLLIFGAISAAFVPLFTQYKKSEKMKEAWELASNLLHLLLILITAFSVAAYFLAPWLATWIAPGFDAQASALTAQLMRILLLSPILFTLSAIFIGLQDSFKTFFYRSLGPLFYNAGIILGILFFGEKYGVIGVAWGVILGAALQLAIQIPALRQIKFRHAWIVDSGRQDVRKAFKFMLPRILGLSLSQLTLFLNTVIASLLAAGSVTIFYFADNLQALPLGMIGIAFAITSFATISELATEKDKTAFARELKSVMQKILFLVIPASLGLFLLRHPIIDLLFVSGGFTSSDGLAVAHALSFLLVSLFAQSLIPVLSRGFYALHDTKTPLMAGAVGAFLSLSLSWCLSLYAGWGVPGIAAGFSAGAVLNAALLYLLMSRRCRYSLLDFWSVLKVIFASGLMFGALWVLKSRIPFPSHTGEQILYISLLSILGIVIYLALSVFLRVEQAKLLLKKPKS